MSIKTIILNLSSVDRSVGDIIREMDAIDRRGFEIETAEDDIQLRSNYKSPRSPPRSPRSPGKASLLDGSTYVEPAHRSDQVGRFIILRYWQDYLGCRVKK